MKTQYYTATSLDGFIATEEDSLEWLFPLGDVNQTSYPAFIAEVGALAMGASTYEWMLRHALNVEAQTRIVDGRRWRSASRTLRGRESMAGSTWWRRSASGISTSASGSAGDGWGPMRTPTIR